MEPDPNNQDLEENTGVNFPGISFEAYMGKTYREVDKTSNSINSRFDLIVVETATLKG